MKGDGDTNCNWCTRKNPQRLDEGSRVVENWWTSRDHPNYTIAKISQCCGLQIKPVEEQLKQQVIGKRYCISRKRKSYKRSTSRSQLAVCLSNVS